MASALSRDRWGTSLRRARQVVSEEVPRTDSHGLAYCPRTPTCSRGSQGISYVQVGHLGHGGFRVTGDHSGAITITRANDLNFSKFVACLFGRLFGKPKIGHGGAKRAFGSWGKALVAADVDSERNTARS